MSGERAVPYRHSEWYSSDIAKARARKNCYRRHLSSFKSGRQRNTIAKEVVLAGIGERVELPATLEEAKQAYQESLDEFKQAQERHKELRREQQARQIEEYELDGEEAAAKRIATIQKMEREKAMFAIVRKLRNPFNNQGVKRVDIPKTWPPAGTDMTTITDLPDPKKVDKTDPTLWNQITAPREVEFYIQLRNRLHFGQAKNTPFASEPLAHLLDWQATSKLADDLLIAEVPIDGIDTATQDNLNRIHLIEPQAATGVPKQVEGLE